MRLIKKYNALSLPIKAAIWFIVGNFITRGVSFITIPIFARYLSTDEYGKVSIFMTYQGILINFATFEMYSGAYIRGILKYKENVLFFTWSEQLLSTLITITVFILCIPIMPWFVLKAQIDSKIYILMYCYFLFFPAYQCWVERKRFNYKYRPVVISALIYTFLSTVIPLIAIKTIQATASIRISFMLLVEALFCVPFYLRNIHIKELYSNRMLVFEQWKFLILFQLPSVIHALSYIILSSMDRIMIGDMVGNSEAGIYSVAATIASVITILCISVNQVLKPWRYQRMEEGAYKTIKEKSSVILIIFGLAILLWILVAPDGLRLLFSEEYHQAIWVIPPVSMSVFFVFQYSMFVDVEEYYLKTKYTMYATTISAATNVIMNYFAIRIWGYIACAYTTLICYVLLSLLHLLWSSKTAKAHGISIQKIYDVRKILVLSICLILSEVVVTITYNNDIIRYILVAFLFVICLLNIKKILFVLKEIKRAKTV